MKNQLNRVVLSLGAAVGIGASATGANAAMDITSVTTAISDAVTAGGTIGGLVLAMLVGFAAYKWIRRPAS